MPNLFIYILVAFLVSATSGFFLIPSIISFCKKHHIYDVPNQRKVHSNAIPRLGGVCFLPSMLLALLIALAVFGRVTGEQKISANPWTLMFLFSLLIVYATGLIDDIAELRPRTKFIAQVVAASLLPISGLYLNNFYGLFGIHEVPFWVGAPLTVFIIVFIDNAINLIDGIDGLSSGLTFISLSGFLYCFARESVWVYCILIAGLMGVLVPFMYYNLFGKPEKNTKIFMGDSGSLTLGFILAFLVVKFAMDNPRVMPFRQDGLLLSYTLLIIPTFDVVRVILKRIRLHHGIFEADKNHIHHKLLAAGLNQHQALITILSFEICYMVLNLVVLADFDITYIVVTDVIIFMVFHLMLDVVIHRRELLKIS